ncbi:MAG: hypothetical protein WC472_03435 [Candidatus Paceibacterota bacterium]
MQRKVVALELLIIALVAIIGGCIFISGCTSTQNNPWEYFPMDVNTQWHYKIFANSDNPLLRETIQWPHGTRVTTYNTKGIYLAEAGKSYDLILKVKGSSEKYPDGVLVETVKDDLKIFDVGGGLHKEIYWSPMNKDKGAVAINQEIMFDWSYAPFAFPSFIDGYSDKAIFFVDEPNEALVKQNDPNTPLIFIGTDYNVPGYNGQPCLHLLRQVSPDSLTEVDSFDKFFTEDMWFAKGKGLVHLEQKIEGQKSMTWTLEKFVPGNKA